MNDLYAKYIKKKALPTLFCPGCGNGIVQYAAIEAFEKLGIRNDTACVSGIGCSSWIPCYFKMDVMHTTHGRAIAFAEGLKIAQPDKNIVVFSGDGDCLAIGGNHLLHACARNIDITVIMINNMIYGMTGGQKSPATPTGARTHTSPYGAADVPMKGSELAMTIGASYVARWTTAHPVQLEKAIEDGIKHKGFSFIEVLSQCPVQAGKNVFKEKDPVKIMEMFKEQTYVWHEGDPEQPGKTKIGLLKKDDDAIEYIDRVNNVLRENGIER